MALRTRVEITRRLLAGLFSLALVVGCAHKPKGLAVWNSVVKSESASVSGKKAWSQHYSYSYQAMNRLVAQPRVLALREHFFEMLGYARAMDDEKITLDEFTLIRIRAEAELHRRVKDDPPMVALLPGESPQSQTSVGDVISAVLGIGLGAVTIYSATTPAPRQQTVCTTSRPVGNTLQTICR